MGRTISANTYNALGQRVRDITLSGATEEAYGAGGELLWRFTGDANSRQFVPFQGGILAEYWAGGTLDTVSRTVSPTRAMRPGAGVAGVARLLCRSAAFRCDLWASPRDGWTSFP
jgi:hypothetical protein